jgi:hypothetical protein
VRFGRSAIPRGSRRWDRYRSLATRAILDGASDDCRAAQVRSVRRDRRTDRSCPGSLPGARTIRVRPSSAPARRGR